MTPALRWLDERLAAQGTSADEMVDEELQLQGAANVTVRNVITSMRLISDIDWAEFFESVSLVDEVLRAGSDFDAMDFPTRDLYRHAIEELARGSNRTEIDVALRSLEAARRAHSGPTDPMDATPQREQDPGLLPDLEGARSVRARARIPRAARHLVRARDRCGRDRRLSRLDRGRDRSAARRRARRCRGSGDVGVAAVRARAACADPGIRRGGRAREPDRDGPVRAEGAARPRAAQWRTAGAAHARRRPDAAHLPHGNRGADRAARGAPSLASPEGDVRFALLSDWTDAASETRAG